MTNQDKRVLFFIVFIPLAIICALLVYYCFELFYYTVFYYWYLLPAAVLIFLWLIYLSPFKKEFYTYTTNPDGTTKKKFTKFYYPIVATAAIVVLLSSIVLWPNYYLGNEEYMEKAVVVDKDIEGIRKRKSKRSYETTIAFENGRATIIGKPFYNSVREGDTVTVPLRRGYFGLPVVLLSFGEEMPEE
ncbi:MAG: hypothetical protein IKM65_09115 [Bacteroidaceae bacterium]|nr:hypothetical protein [Bacteroidaceae bacterium]